MAAQDMPPPGGFGQIPISRTVAKPLIRQGVWLLGTTLATLYGLVYLGEARKRYRVLKIEQMEHYIATLPFLYAEQERKFLKQLYLMRENERKLMKDHPGWIVGTLYGEPIYKTVPKGYLPPIVPDEFTFGRTVNEWEMKVQVPDWFI